MYKVDVFAVCLICEYQSVNTVAIQAKSTESTSMQEKQETT